MTTRSVEHPYSKDHPGFNYMIGAAHTWCHYDPEHLPQPIQAWLDKNMPGTAIEKVVECDPPVSVWAHGQEITSEIIQTTADFPRPLFMIGFTEEQAEYFKREYPAASPDTPEGEGDFCLFEWVEP